MSSNTKITINELAEMAHVAKSTVSKALNGQSGVSEETRDRITKLAKQLNFQPDFSARALAQSKTGAIGFVLPHAAAYSLADQFWTGIMTAVCEITAIHSNHMLLVSPSNIETNPFSSLEPLLRSHAVDGLIIGAEQLDKRSMMTVMLEEIPFVFIGRNPLVNHFCVDVDNEEGAYQIVQKLCDKGYRNIGCISGPPEYLYIQERIAGYKKALEEKGMANDHVMHSLYEQDETVRVTKEFLAKYPQTDALFITGGGEFILNIIETIKKVTHSNDSLGLGAFDDSRYFDLLNVKIITARQPIEMMGKMATRMLYELIEGRTPAKKELFLPVEIIDR